MTGPKRIARAEYDHMNLDEKVAIGREIMAGKTILTNDPWEFKPRRVLHADYNHMTLDEKHAVNVELMAGKTILVEEE